MIKLCFWSQIEADAAASFLWSCEQQPVKKKTEPWLEKKVVSREETKRPKLDQCIKPIRILIKICSMHSMHELFKSVSAFGHADNCKRASFSEDVRFDNAGEKLTIFENF